MKQNCSWAVSGTHFYFSSSPLAPASGLSPIRITLTESRKDTSVAGGGVVTKDTGSLTASLTIPGLANASGDNWSNMVIGVSVSPYQGSQILRRHHVRRREYPRRQHHRHGGHLYLSRLRYQRQYGHDGRKLFFSRSGNTLTISDTTPNPPALQPPGLPHGPVLSYGGRSLHRPANL